MTYRVLMLAPTPYFSDRGCHVRIYEEARVLRQLGHDVRIVTYHIGRTPQGIPTYRIARIPWYRKLSAGPSWHKPYLDILLLAKAWRVARQFRPHLIHAHLHEGAFLAALLKPLLGLPVVFDCQGSLTGELVDHRFVGNRSLLYKIFYALEGWINRRADHILTSSTPTAELMRNEFSLDGQRVSVLVDGVGAEQVFAKEELAQLARGLELPPDKRLVVFLGAMNEYQGVDLLLEVVGKITRNRDDLHFLLMGYPEAGYRRQAEALGLSRHITFTGKIPYEQAGRYLSLGDIAVSPKLSRTEANGKLFNYMACGLPAVVFDTPVNREILGEAGIYADYGDAASFAAAIARGLDDAPRRAALFRLSRERVFAEHGWTRRATVLLEIYRRLLPGQGVQ